MQNCFTIPLKEGWWCLIIPQYVDQIPKVYRYVGREERTVGDLMKREERTGVLEVFVETLNLGRALERDITVLKGGGLAEV